MFFNKLTYPRRVKVTSPILAILLVAGLAFVATSATEAVTPVLSVPDEVETVVGDKENTDGIQVYGIRAESVSFELTITFQDDPSAPNPVNTPVTGFDVSDIELFAADSNERIVTNGATVSPVRPNADDSVYTTTITAKGNIDDVVIRIPAGAAKVALSIQQAIQGETADPTELVLCQSLIEGYSFLSLIRASSVVNRQWTVVPC